MRSVIACTFALIGWCLLAQDAAAADRDVALRLLAPLSHDVDAFPRVADPVDDAGRKINGALDRLDAAARKGMAECRREGRGRASWERMFTVPVTGSGLLSFHWVDNVYCGGAHPSVGNAAIVYDLRSGAPVDWTKLLPPTLTGEVALSETMDGVKLVTLSSARLHRVYLDAYRPRTGKPAEDASDDECREAVAATRDGKPPGMMAWLTPGGEGLAVQFDLEHAVQACADEITIPIATLRTEGASPGLIRALETAHPPQVRR